MRMSELAELSPSS
ncbi:hypothetical protein F383_06106 [Gossypium arboreum]|uniref:Uncharacterized protein n=1 Tax=Gossypium arboreum TaxID=29729 RepID=A0A0B0P6Y7_GOSAR|nr:hypothetical protein F383_06106 [Gossypium arboreum]